ncbi:unnamed protein product [Mesocestoides corti]|uniref:C2H2-type domain-containing protein n=1 Tax=Mesocestoides corti TaxID=53468 RepID=A0A3P6HM04_MESCO|nr:unnamed protein product [Mesocestoides corti]
MSVLPEKTMGHPFECPECGLVYTRKHALERHIAFSHNGETAFRCEFCSFHALDRANFRQHMSRHFHLKNFACEEKERKITVQPSALSVSSVFWIADGSIWKTAYTGRSSGDHSSLMRHVADQNEKTEQTACDAVLSVCSFLASQYLRLVVHRVFFFCCPFQQCDHRCITKQELADHVRFKHSDKRDFKCPDCQATFKVCTQGTLSRHQKTHTDISFLCNLCDASFNRMSNLKRHKASVHAKNKRARGRPQKIVRQEGEKRPRHHKTATEVAQPDAALHQADDLWAVQAGEKHIDQHAFGNYDPVQEHSSGKGIDDRLCSVQPPLQPVYVVAYETENGWVPANPTSVPDDTLLIPPPEPPREPVLPCVTDFFSSTTSSSANAFTCFLPVSTDEEHQTATHPAPSANHIWRPGDDGVDDDLGTANHGGEDLMCDFLPGLSGDAGGMSPDRGQALGSSNFSVGYLIGGGSGASGVSLVDPHDSVPSSTSELHALPTSDCLSLMPIVTSAFDETTGNTTFQPFWSSASGYSAFDQQQDSV